MSDERATAALAAQALHAAARAHKREEAYHRRQARALMRQHDEFVRALNERGITVHIDTAQEAKS